MENLYINKKKSLEALAPDFDCLESLDNKKQLYNEVLKIDKMLYYSYFLYFFSFWRENNKKQKLLDWIRLGLKIFFQTTKLKCSFNILPYRT